MLKTPPRVLPQHGADAVRAAEYMVRRANMKDRGVDQGALPKDMSDLVNTFVREYREEPTHSNLEQLNLAMRVLNKAFADYEEKQKLELYRYRHHFKEAAEEEAEEMRWGKRYMAAEEKPEEMKWFKRYMESISQA